MVTLSCTFVLMENLSCVMRFGPCRGLLIGCVPGAPIGFRHRGGPFSMLCHLFPQRDSQQHRLLLAMGCGHGATDGERHGCSCQGHVGHGRCYHRALCIHLADVQGVDVMTVPTIGFSPRGVSLTIGHKPAAKAVAS